MESTGSVAVRKLMEFFSAQDTGLGPVVEQLAIDSGIALAPLGVVGFHAAIELTERSQITKYPVVHVYVDRIRNLLTEKFRRFSGKIRTVAEVRVSQDRIELIEDRLRLYVEGVTQIIDEHRGCWEEGAFYAGGYEVSFDPVKQGGKYFVQVARVTFEVDLSA